MSSLQVSFKHYARTGDVDSVEQAVGEYGLDVCGGAEAFVCAAEEGHTHVLDVLAGAGLRESGEAMMRAISCKQMDSVKFLVCQYEKNSLNFVAGTNIGVIILFKVLEYFEEDFSPKLVHWLIKVGVNTDARVTLIQDTSAPLFITARELIQKFKEKNSREDVPMLYAIDRVLKQEEAIKAHSWVWPRPRVFAKHKKKKGRVVVRIFRINTSHAVLGALWRYTRK